MYGQRSGQNLRLEAEKCTDRLDVRIGEQTKEVLQDLAELEGKTASEYVRTLIFKDIKRNRSKLKPK
jgi:predicted DNA-binding protein